MAGQEDGTQLRYILPPRSAPRLLCKKRLCPSKTARTVIKSILLTYRGRFRTGIVE